MSETLGLGLFVTLLLALIFRGGGIDRAELLVLLAVIGAATLVALAQAFGLTRAFGRARPERKATAGAPPEPAAGLTGPGVGAAGGSGGPTPQGGAEPVHDAGPVHDAEPHALKRIWAVRPDSPEEKP
jgi:hypothetical protein